MKPSGGVNGSLPGVEKTAAPLDAKRCLEELRQEPGGEERSLMAISPDATLAQENHTLHLRKDVFDMVRHEEDRRFGSRNLLQKPANRPRSVQIQTR
jgi:hypothetical protein